MIAASRKPLGGKAYGHIPHLPGSRLGVGDHKIDAGQARILTEKVRDRHDRVIVQEKLDGSCVSVANVGGEILPLIRAGYEASASPRRQHQLFAAWVRHHVERFRAVLADGERLAGEWLLQAHGTRYALSHEPFVAFDVLVGVRRVATVDELRERAARVGFVTPRVIHEGGAVSIEEVLARLEPSGHGALEPVEGAVWRVERRGVTDFLAKFVRHDKADGKYLECEDATLGPVWNVDPSALFPSAPEAA